MMNFIAMCPLNSRTRTQFFLFRFLRVMEPVLLFLWLALASFVRVVGEACLAFNQAAGVCQDVNLTCPGFYGNLTKLPTVAECPGPSNVKPLLLQA
jgi:hypothetical protein